MLGWAIIDVSRSVNPADAEGEGEGEEPTHPTEEEEDGELGFTAEIDVIKADTLLNKSISDVEGEEVDGGNNDNDAAATRSLASTKQQAESSSRTIFRSFSLLQKTYTQR